MISPIEIKEKKIILTEGIDVYYFSIWAYQAFKVTGIQVLDFGGIKDLKKYLKTLILLPGYENVETILIARDAETDSSAAVSSITTALREAALPVPEKPCEFVGNTPKVAYMVFPGFMESPDGNRTLSTGTLEDLCLEIVKDDPIFECVEQYVKCLQAKEPVARLHKTKLHTYLAGKNSFVGLKIGEAAKAGAWDWNHSKLAPFRQLILKM